MQAAPKRRSGIDQARPSQGADLIESGGVRYRTWCRHDAVSVAILDQAGTTLRSMSLNAEGAGYFSGVDHNGAAGDLYKYHFGESQGWPDPASRYQPSGVHGPSMVIDPNAHSWKNTEWKAPAYSDLIIYELHIGTFSGEGTFRGAIPKLDHIAKLGVNAIELMPVADFPGERNWGYDGVALYAPSRAYGHPDDLRALVTAAHERGLAVILDVVYNHLGPDGNYLGVYHTAYFNPEHQTPWGAGLNFKEPAVREFFAGNVTYWQNEFHIDGFRLDATHAIRDSSERHILAEISERVHASGGFLIAEDERNEPELLRPVTAAGFGFDGVWSDDFHHVVRVMLTHDREGYYENFEGTSRELADTLRHGWLFRGQERRTDHEPRGGASLEFTPEHFVYCISNHDQAGNRAFGERLNQVIKPAAYRAASALLCLVPYTPMLFMGQEWSASTPFQFFTDHNPELGKLITEGRRREFRHFREFRDANALTTIPDPQAESTFCNSKLHWDELSERKHSEVHLLYREFLWLRKTHSALTDRSREQWRILETEAGILAIVFGCQTPDPSLILVDLAGGHAPPNMQSLNHSLGSGRTWEEQLSSNEERFGGTNAAPFSLPTVVVYSPNE